jgi:DNA-binding MarR family transcriptional regulator
MDVCREDGNLARMHPADDPQQGLRWSIVDALRRYGTDAARVAHLFAAQHQLQESDLRALVAIMSAEGTGTPLTPRTLRDHLGLSSAGTSYVVDRLCAAGHVERTRDHPRDNRVVHLRHTQQGRATALRFFGPLGDRTERVMDGFTAAELTVVARFLAAAADATHAHLDQLRSPAGDPPVGQRRPERAKPWTK